MMRGSAFLNPPNYTRQHFKPVDKLRCYRSENLRRSRWTRETRSPFEASRDRRNPAPWKPAQNRQRIRACQNVLPRVTTKHRIKRDTFLTNISSFSHMQQAQSNRALHAARHRTSGKKETSSLYVCILHQISQ